MEKPKCMVSFARETQTCLQYTDTSPLTSQGSSGDVSCPCEQGEPQGRGWTLVWLSRAWRGGLLAVPSPGTELGKESSSKHLVGLSIVLQL